MQVVIKGRHTPLRISDGVAEPRSAPWISQLQTALPLWYESRMRWSTPFVLHGDEFGHFKGTRRTYVERSLKGTHQIAAPCATNSRPLRTRTLTLELAESMHEMLRETRGISARGSFEKTRKIFCNDPSKDLYPRMMAKEITWLRVIPTMAFNSSHLTFCLANLLAFYLAFCLKFYLTFYLAYLLAFYLSYLLKSIWHIF